MSSSCLPLLTEETPLELQVKLLRVLETSTVMRVGGNDTLCVDVRMIAATNRPLEQAVATGKLREDLLYRLNVFPIHLPTLWERKEDVELLARHFLDGLNKQAGVTKEFTRAAIERLRTHRWPGNVRELRNVVQRAFIMAEENIDLESLPLGEGGGGASFGGERCCGESCLHLKVGTSVAEVEHRLILATLESVSGNKKKASDLLKISLKTLYNRLNQYRGGPRTARSAGRYRRLHARNRGRLGPRRTRRPARGRSGCGSSEGRPADRTTRRLGSPRDRHRR